MGLKNDKGQYVVIPAYSGTKPIMTISVFTYESRDTYKNGDMYLDYEVINFTPNVTDTGVNPIKQGYLELRKDKIKYPIDVLEDGQMI